MNKELLKYFNGDDFAAGVWLSKYAQQGEITPDDMHKRMAKEFAKIEDRYYEKEYKETSHPDGKKGKLLSKYGQNRDWLTEDVIFDYFKDFKYIIPQGSIMSQLGSKSIGSLSNCFVIGQPEDSYGGIFQKDEEQAQLMKRRGGVGQDISTLRPAKVATSNAAKSSTGPVSFMHRFSNTTREVAQDGRRGALMLSIHINHPDVLDFIKVKRNDTEVTGANISIKLTDEFMKAVENDDDFILRWPCDLKYENLTREDKIVGYNELKNCGDGKYIKRIKAKEYWEELIESAHGYAEPGLMFESNHHNYSPDGVYPQFKGVTTNPCGEIFMQPYDACRLIAVNLFSFVKNPFTEHAAFDWDKFYSINYEAMRLSDDLIDLEMEYISRIIRKIDSDTESFEVKRRERELWEKVYKTAKASRRTGLGITALGDALAALGVGYDSEEGMIFIKAIMQTKLRSEFDCSIDLAIIRGPFEGWDNNKEFDLIASNELVGKNDFYAMLVDEFPSIAERMYDYGRRNVSPSTIAPTGSLSIIAKATEHSNLSSGMEPTFMPYYMRRKKVNPNDENTRIDFTDENGDTWQEYPIVMGAFKDWILAQRHKKGIIIDRLSKEEMEEWFKKSPWYGSTANDIDWTKRVEIQALLQRYISHSISSTVNLPNDVKKSEVGNIYMEAWKQGLKGITVYRDGSRSGVLISNDAKNFEAKDAVKRPKDLNAETHYSTSKGESYHVIIGLLENKPYEIFIDDSDNRYSQKGIITKKGRGNYVFKNGGDPINIRTFMSDEQEAITRLVSANLRHGVDIKFVVEQLQKTPGDMFSFTKSLARVLKKYIPDGSKSTVQCLDCKSDNVMFMEGCQMCKDCGSSKCG